MLTQNIICIKKLLSNRVSIELVEKHNPNSVFSGRKASQHSKGFPFHVQFAKISLQLVRNYRFRVLGFFLLLLLKQLLLTLSRISVKFLGHSSPFSQYRQE